MATSTADSQRIVLTRAARAFRAAVGRARAVGRLPLAGDRSWFHTFPRGQCDHTARLLAAWLIEEGWADVRTATGGHAIGRAHRWCEVGDIVVDVTADQFPEVSDRVVVSPRAESPWGFHRGACGDGPLATEIDDLAHHVPDYRRAYDAIVAEIEVGGHADVSGAFAPPGGRGAVR